MDKRGFTLPELLVVVAMIALLATAIVVNVGHAGREAREVRTQALISDVKLGIEKYVNDIHKYPFVADAKGCFNVDDVWRELSPLSPDLTAGRQPSDPAFRNKSRIECLSVVAENLSDTGDGQKHVVDSWGRPFCMQWDYCAKKTMIWSAGGDGLYDISDDHVLGGHSSLWGNAAQAKPQTPPVITAEILEQKIRQDLSNY